MEFTGERYIGSLSSAQISYEHRHRYLFASEFVRNKNVLDVASGEGYGTSLLAQTAEKVIGVDISQDAILWSGKTYPAKNLSFIEGSCTKIPIEGEFVFDVVVSFETIEHINAGDQILFLKEIKRLLKPDGILIISTPNKKIYSDKDNYKNEFHLKEFYRDEFGKFLKKYFSKVFISGQQIFTGSTIMHPGGKSKMGFSPYFLNYTDTGFIPDTGEHESTYMIAVCSENPVKINDSLLADKSMRLLHERDESWSKEIEKIHDNYQGNNVNLFILLNDDTIIQKNAELKENHFILTFDLHGITGIKQVRFDPTENRICKVKIASVKVKSPENECTEFPLGDLTSNGVLLSSGFFSFETLDPMIYIRVTDPVESITLEGVRELSTIQGVDELIRAKNAALDQKIEELRNKNKTLDKTKEELNQKNDELKEKEQMILNLHQTLTGRDNQIADLNQALTERNSQIAGFNQSLTER
jgi:O-antigen biosynthesis protein